MSRNKKKGFTLIELLLGFAIIMLLAVSAFFVYKKVSTSMAVERIYNSVNVVYANSYSVFANASYKPLSGDLDNKFYDILAGGAFQRGGLFKLLGNGGYTNKDSDAYFLITSNKKTNTTAVSMALIVKSEYCAPLMKRLIGNSNYLVNAGDAQKYGSSDAYNKFYAKSDSGNTVTPSHPLIEKPTMAQIAKSCNSTITNGGVNMGVVFTF